MLTHADNELLVRTNSGTPMGETLRRYWIPACLSNEVAEPDGPPVRIKLMGEDLVAFRDTSGKVGLIDEFCAHRRTSLWLGRNEECGLRCVYHGWKYDVDGNCVDMMNEPAGSKLKEEVKLRAYPTVDMGGVIWAYMGPKDKQPAEPRFEWTQVPEDRRGVSKNVQECNWLQALEAGVDTAHVPILHRVMNDDSGRRGGYNQNSEFAKGSAPVVEVDVTDYGYRYAGIRTLPGERRFVRTYQYVMPFHQIRPEDMTPYGGPPGRPFISGHMWVPTDDENCMVYNWAYTFDGTQLTEWEALEASLGRGPGDLDENFLNVRNKSNAYMIDREVQKTETFTGIEGVNNQDQAAQEMMGPIVDRSKEFLTASDLAIVQMRRLLMQAVRTVSDGGDPPAITDNYYMARAVDRFIGMEDNWLEVLLPEINP